eukprot:7389469-Prymnesium_polylepis.1
MEVARWRREGIGVRASPAWGGVADVARCVCEICCLAPHRTTWSCRPLPSWGPPFCVGWGRPGWGGRRECAATGRTRRRMR